MKKTAPVTKIPIDFDLRQLEIFCKVVEIGSFSKAAKEVFLAQASVSERISTLENMVGTRLIDRLGREIAPTKAGEILYKHAILLLDMKKNACIEMQQFLGATQGEIRVGASTIPGEYILPRVMGSFQEKYPLVSVNLTISDSSEIENSVLKGNFEIGVIGFKSLDRNLICRSLWQDELVVAVPPYHRWSGRKEISPDELSGEPFILREPGSGTLRAIDNHLKTSTKGIESLSPVTCLGTSTAVKEGIKAGLGISIISSRAIETEIKAGILKELRVKDLQMRRNFYLIRDIRRISSPLCSAMIEFLINTSSDI